MGVKDRKWKWSGEIENNQNIGLFRVQIYVYTKFIDMNFLGHRVDAFVIFI